MPVPQGTEETTFPLIPLSPGAALFKEPWSSGHQRVNEAPRDVSSLTGCLFAAHWYPAGGGS